VSGRVKSPDEPRFIRFVSHHVALIEAITVRGPVEVPSPQIAEASRRRRESGLLALSPSRDLFGKKMINWCRSFAFNSVFFSLSTRLDSTLSRADGLRASINDCDHHYITIFSNQTYNYELCTPNVHGRDSLAPYVTGCGGNAGKSRSGAIKILTNELFVLLSLVPLSPSALTFLQLALGFLGWKICFKLLEIKAS
jgi:hypothetical protein